MSLTMRIVTGITLFVMMADSVQVLRPVRTARSVVVTTATL
jgi:hypothetical protein